MKGYKLVPLELTKEMREAAMDADAWAHSEGQDQWTGVAPIWEALLAAAPQPTFDEAKERADSAIALLECVLDTGELTREKHLDLEADICRLVTEFWGDRKAARIPSPPPRCPNCGYTEQDCREQMDHHLCGYPDPAKSAQTLSDFPQRQEPGSGPGPRNTFHAGVPMSSASTEYSPQTLKAGGFVDNTPAERTNTSGRAHCPHDGICHTSNETCAQAMARVAQIKPAEGGGDEPR